MDKDMLGRFVLVLLVLSPIICAVIGLVLGVMGYVSIALYFVYPFLILMGVMCIIFVFHIFLLCFEFVKDMFWMVVDFVKNG